MMNDTFTFLFQDIGTFWSAVQAIATVIGVGFLIFELRKFLKEMTAYKIEGLKMAKEELDSDRFRSSLNALVEFSNSGNYVYSKDLAT